MAQVYKLFGSRNLVLAFTTIHRQFCVQFWWTAPLHHFFHVLHSHTSLKYRANRCDRYHGCQFDHFLALHHCTDMLHSLYFITVRLCQLVGNFRGGWTYSVHNNCMALHLDARRRGVVTLCPSSTPQGRTVGSHWLGNWVCPRANLDILGGGNLWTSCEWNHDVTIFQPIAQSLIVIMILKTYLCFVFGERNGWWRGIPFSIARRETRVPNYFQKMAYIYGYN